MPEVILRNATQLKSSDDVINFTGSQNSSFVSQKNSKKFKMQIEKTFSSFLCVDEANKSF